MNFKCQEVGNSRLCITFGSFSFKGHKWEQLPRNNFSKNKYITLYPYVCHRKILQVLKINM